MEDEKGLKGIVEDLNSDILRLMNGEKPTKTAKTVTP